MNNLFTYRFAFLHKCLSFVVVFLFVVGGSFAATFTSSQSGDWNNSATWGGAGVPGAGDDVVIGGNWWHDITVDLSEVECNNLTLQNGGELIVNSNTVIVNGNLVCSQWDYSITFTSGGVLKVAGNIDLQGVNDVGTIQGFHNSSLGTLELIGSSVQTINIVTSGHVIGALKQSASSSNNFSINGSGTLTCYTYDQNCNSVNLVNGDSQIIVGAGGTINTACYIPTITTSETTLSGFGYCEGAASSTSTSDLFTISGENLVGTGNITVTGSTNFEVSTDNSTFSASVTYAYASGVITAQPKTVYVRLKSSASTGSYNENITVSGGDADSKTVACSGSVDAQPVGGSVSGGTTICSGNTSETLTLASHTGTISKWQYSNDNFSSDVHDIAHTSTTYTSGALTETTYFRAIISNGICSDAQSSSTTVTVLSVPTGGTVSGGSTICEGETSGELSLSGHSGSVVKWQSSTDGGSTWSDIVNTNTTYTSGALTQNTDFHAVLTNGTCTSNSASATVSVDSEPVGGSISPASNTICESESTGTLTLSGQSGTIAEWQKSTDGGSTWPSIVNTSTTHSESLTESTDFRVVISNGVCADVYSSLSEITVVAAPTGGTVSGDAEKCEGETVTVTLSGHSDDVQKWQSSTDGGSTWSDIVNATTTYTSDALSQTTVYRAVLTNGTCTTNSATHTVTVNALPAISVHPSTAQQDECKNVAAAALSVTASGAGLTYQWYKNTSESNSGGTLISGAASSSYTPVTTTAGTLYYYCVVSGTCSPAATSDVSGAVITREIPTATASANTPLYENAILELYGGPSGMATYSWSGPNSFSSNERNPTDMSISSADAGDYTLTVMSLYGCSDDATVNVSISEATDFYYDGSGSIATLSNWGTNTDGSGTNPTDFTSDGQTFNIIHNSTTTPTLGAAWSVSGNGSKVVVGDGTNATNFTIPAAYSLTTGGTVDVDVKNNATLTITNASSPSLGYLASGSTVVYNGSGTQTVKGANYYNLSLDNTRGGVTVTLESGTISVSNTFTVSGLGTLDSDYVISATDNTFIFDGTGDQDIPAFQFNNLHTELGGTKTVTGNIIINNNLKIGAISTLNGGVDKTIELAGSSSVVTIIGRFTPGTGTVEYTSASDVTVGAMNYNNLNLSGGDRTLQSSNIIGVAGTFTPGAGSNTIDGSSISFNGSSAQDVPAFTFNNLIINNTSTGVTMLGNVSVAGMLTMTEGVLDVNSNILTITNTDANAVSDGSKSSYINGTLSRNIAANLSSASGTYKFPLGVSAEYYGFSINTLTTGASAPVVSVDVTVANPSGTTDVLLTGISNAEYWDVSYTGDLTSAKVTLTDSAGLGSHNAIGHAVSSGGEYTSIFGSVSGNSIINSEVTTFSSFQLATRSISTVTYVYDCTGDLDDNTSWIQDENANETIDGGEVSNPANFSIDDATWIIDCNVTLSSDLNISGFNTTLQINASNTLTVNDNVSLTLNGDLDLHGNIVTNEGSSIELYGSSSLAMGSSIDNTGALSFYEDVIISKASIVNRTLGTINVDNADFTFSAVAEYSPVTETQFVNYGYLEVVNGNFSVLNAVGDEFNSKIFVDFTNASGGYILVDNTLAPTKEVNFTNLVLDVDAVSLEAGSTFKVKHSDVDMALLASLSPNLSGHIIVEDGDLSVHESGGGTNFTVDLVEGGIFLSDTDDSGDGILNLGESGGAMTFNVEGTVYAEGIAVDDVLGGGNSINVKDGGAMFVGNIGASLPDSYTYNLTVEDGGTLNYCGNKTASGDDVGTVDVGGTLNYAESYYTTQTPDSQSDFDVSGSEIALYNSAEECLAAFDAGVSGDNLLPITLTMLYAECGNGGVIIHWQTVSEENNSHFTLYRSFDGINFEEIAVVLGAGISNEIINYEYTDNPERDGLVYYILEQTDFDGTTTQSKIIMIHTCQDKNENIFRISPDEIVVDFVNPYEVNYVVITSVDGKIVYTRQYAGKKQAVIPNRFTSGIYVITNYTQSFITSQKFIKK
ncbi:MAG: hypothetical protein PF481_07050 [Bacteroidales bacterium]|jgi:hypothetical protein|nr:hypothetical protein [Bacteroidales bacterium]